MPNNFPCNKCGLCCRRINLVLELAEYDLGNGVCKYLKDNLCSIYEHRPEICRVDVMYSLNYANQYSKEEFYRLNLIVCRRLQDKAGMSEEQQVTIM